MNYQQQGKIYISAFEKTIKHLILILTPILILSYVKDFHENLDYIRNNPIIALILVSVIVTIYISNISIQLKNQKKYLLLCTQQGTYAVSVNKSFRVRKLLLRTGLFLSVIIILISMALLIISYTTNAHYVVIASEPNKESAEARISYMNMFIEKNDIDGLKVYAYPSTGSNNWFMITINRSHSTKKAAEKTMQKAKKELGKKIPTDAYIYTSDKVSIVAKLKNYLL